MIYIAHKISTISDDIKDIRKTLQGNKQLPEYVIELLNKNKRNDAVICFSKSEGVSISRANQLISHHEKIS